ncbi:MAG TPA: CoA ester lyase [Candidatus Acidoferrales bacterium]|nr:CoA ester lyase [Candidatus Acidoferrales bacterium]
MTRQTDAHSRWPPHLPPVRSLLFAPGGRPDMLAKAAGAGADAVVMDLEDAVPEANKASARQNVASALAGEWRSRSLAVVRINGVGSRHWQADLRAAAGKNLRAIMLPKCQSPAEAVAAGRLLGRLEKARRLKRGSVKIFLLVETPLCLLRLEAILQATPRIVLLALGAEDLALHTGLSRSPDDRELLVARSWVGFAAAAYGCLAIDSVYMKYHDLPGLARESEQAKRMGYSGKLLVHPGQIETTHSAFAPSAEDLARAAEIVRLAEEMNVRGAGAAGLKGELVDRPVIERARRILAANRAAG